MANHNKKKASNGKSRSIFLSPDYAIGEEEEDDSVGTVLTRRAGAGNKSVDPEDAERRRLSRMEAFHAREGERATCLTFCRDTITRLADKQHLQKAQIETLLAGRVS